MSRVEEKHAEGLWGEMVCSDCQNGAEGNGIGVAKVCEVNNVFLHAQRCA